MKIEGTSEVPAPRDRVWAAFLDPDTLAKAIPGCEKLEEVGPNEYKATMKVGVGPIKGTFDGKVRLFDLEPPNKYRMAVEGTGTPGFVRGDASMLLSDVEGGNTRVGYNADVQVGGLIASVGQRMLGGVSKMMLDQFFGRMTELLAEKKS
jgi:carbon monoxide dehydrogenase subunit G